LAALTAVLVVAALSLRETIVAPISELIEGLEQERALAGNLRLDEATRLAAAIDRRVASARSEERAAAIERETALRAELAAAQQTASLAQSSLAALEPLSEALASWSRGDLSARVSHTQSIHPLAARLDQTIELLAKTMFAFSASLGAIRDSAASMRVSVEGFGDEVYRAAARAEAAAGALARKTESAARWAAQLTTSAELARELMGEASQQSASLQQGGAKFDQILRTSQQMAPILAAVDEVAFQTNFLALNAGVEAARLGAGGRGIAVVAQELRLLSQRATAAAKQSSGLLSLVVAEAERGAKFLSSQTPALAAISERAAKIVGLLELAGLELADRKVAVDAPRAIAQCFSEATSAQRRLVDEVDVEASSLEGLVDKLSDLIDRFRVSSEPTRVAPLGALPSPVTIHRMAD
jgi:methyl-accepting chemotaxis protein